MRLISVAPLLLTLMMSAIAFASESDHYIPLGKFPKGTQLVLKSDIRLATKDLDLESFTNFNNVYVEDPSPYFSKNMAVCQLVVKNYGHLDKPTTRLKTGTVLTVDSSYDFDEWGGDMHMIKFVELTFKYRDLAHHLGCWFISETSSSLTFNDFNAMTGFVFDLVYPEND